MGNTCGGSRKGRRSGKEEYGKEQSMHECSHMSGVVTKLP